MKVGVNLFGKWGLGLRRVCSRGVVQVVGAAGGWSVWSRASILADLRCPKNAEVMEMTALFQSKTQ